MMYIYAGDDHIAVLTDRIDAEMHSHLMLQLSISLHHEFSIVISGKEISCKGILINSNVRHTLSGNEEEQLLLLIDPTSMLADQLNRLYLQDQPYHLINDDVLCAIQSTILEYYPILCQDDYLKFYSQMLQLLRVDINENVEFDRRINELLNSIKAGYQAEYSIDEMAKRVFLSQSRLSHLFKDETSICLYSYILLHKLQKAMFQIYSGSNITEAAMEAGFDSPSHFAAICKKTLGMSARKLTKDSFFLKVNMV